ncbi:MAG: hypothetical protein RhofKO_20950 [Rhodothermales bacterium]
MRSLYLLFTLLLFLLSRLTMRLSILPLLLLLAVFGIACEPASPPAPSDTAPSAAEQARTSLEASDGGQLVLRTIEAHGGLEAWYDAPTSSYTWEYANLDGDIRFKSFLVADNASRRVYHDLMTLGTYDNAEPVAARFAWDGTDAWMSPDTISNPNPRFWATTGYYFQSIPFILADPGLTYERQPDAELNGTTYELVKVGFEDGVGDSSGDTYTLYVHPETSLVDAIRYTVTFGRGRPADDAQPRETLMFYEDYVTVDGLTTPTRFRGFHYGDGAIIRPKNDAWSDSISFRRPFDESKLAMPSNARIAPAPGS